MKSDQGLEVGVLIERTRAYGRLLCEGVASFATQHPNWQLTLLDGFDLKDTRKMRRFDGFICRFLDTKIPRRILRFNKPTVDVYHDRPLKGIFAVDSDHVGIGRAAALHLLDRRFVNFAFCGHNGCGYSDGRYRGFVETLQESGFTCSRYDTPKHVRYRFDNDTIFADPTQDEGDAHTLRKWVASLPKPVAVFCSHDFRAYQLVLACKSENLAIPREVAVVGVDDDALLCSFTRPAISSVDPDAFGVGFAAAETLDALMNGRADAWKNPRYIPCKDVVARESTNIYPISPSWLADALTFIRRSAAIGISAADVCQHVGKSHTVVSRHFRRVLGLSIQKEICRTRLAESRRLLSQGLPPVEVTSLTGFRSLSYFSKCFAAAFGVPPSQYAGNGRQRKMP